MKQHAVHGPSNAVKPDLDWSQVRETVLLMLKRLTHLSNSLDELGKLLATPHQLYNPYAWGGLQEQIKSKYTVES